MNIHMTNIASYGPVAWISENGLQAITVKIHSEKPRPKPASVHINPNVRALPEVLGEFHQKNG